MTITKGRIERAGQIVFHDASFAVWEDGLHSGMDWNQRRQWELLFKHQVFYRIVQQLNRLGWIVGEWDQTERFKAIALNHRSCSKGDLRAELSVSGRHIEFKVWQDAQNVENPNGGKYDFNKERRMTYLQRLEMERTRRRIRDYLLNVFIGYEFKPPPPRIGLSGLTATEYASYQRKHTGHYVPELDRAAFGMKCNSRAADGGTIEHGAKVWALDHKGRLVTGTAYYMLNSGWHIVTGRYGLLYTHTGSIFSIKPDNLRLKRNSSARRKKLEEQMQTAIAAMNFERAAVLRDILRSPH